MLRKPAFWIALVVMSAASAILALRLFPHAFPLVQLELTIDRETAIEEWLVAAVLSGAAFLCACVLMLRFGLLRRARPSQ